MHSSLFSYTIYRPKIQLL